MRRHSTPLLVAPLLLSALAVATARCGDAPSLASTTNAHVEYFVDSREVPDKLIHDINTAQSSIDVALSAAPDSRIIKALKDKAAAGIAVHVVADVEELSAFTQDLCDGATTNHVECRFVDGELKYLPDANLVALFKKPKGYLIRPGRMNVLSHNFVLIDKTIVWDVANNLANETTPQIGYRVESELLHEDFTREFKQLFSQVTSTSLDVYNGPVKSAVLNHPYSIDNEPFFYNDSLYTDQGRLRILFSPQDHIIKTLIDEIYRAKSSIYIQSDMIDDRGVVRALTYKAKNGFKVKIVVKNSAQTRFRTELNALNGTGSDVIRTVEDHIPTPTVVVIDSEKNERTDQFYPQLSFVISHPILSTTPLEIIKSLPDDTYKIYLSDYFNDGNAWVLSEVNSQEKDRKIKTIESLKKVIESTYEQGNKL